MEPNEVHQVADQISDELDPIIQEDVGGLIYALRRNIDYLASQGMPVEKAITASKFGLIQSYVTVMTGLCINLDLPKETYKHSVEELHKRIYDSTTEQTQEASKAIAMLVLFISSRVLIDVVDVDDTSKESASRSSDDLLKLALETLNAIR